MMNSIYFGKIGGFELIDSTYYITASEIGFTKGYLIRLKEDLTQIETFEYGF